MFLLLLLACAIPEAQPAQEPVHSDFAIENWQTEDGLPQNSVTSVFQSDDGYIYGGTYNGIIRFDGIRFVIYESANTPELKNSRITSLYQDARGAIWIGHETGDISWMQDGVFHSFDTGTNWPGGEISAFGTDSAGDLWAVNHDGVLVRLRDKKLVRPLPGIAGSRPNAPDLVRETDGTFWMMYRGVAARLQDGEIKPFLFGASDTNAYFERACPCHDGGLWVAGERQLRKWDGNRWTRNLGAFPWDQAYITSMIELRSGELLVGTLDVGLFIIAPDGGVSHLSRTNGLPHDWVRSLAEDREGNIWVGTGGGGLCVLRARKVTMFSPADDWQGRLVLSVAQGSDGGVWAGTEGGGLYRYSHGVWDHFDSARGLGSPFVWSALQDSRGNVWAGTWLGGLFLKSDDRFRLAPGLESFTVPVTALMEADHGSLLLGTLEGLLRYDDGQPEWLMRADHAPWPDVRALAREPDGSVWLGMNSGGGLGRWHEGRVTTFGKKDGLPSNFILSLYLDADGALWIGSLDNGLGRYKNGKFAIINSKVGLPNDVICGIADDGLGNLWFSSQNGIFRVTKSNLNSFADGEISAVHCIVYGKRQGLATLACSGGFQPAVCRTSDGRIWFPTGKGLAVVNPRDVRVNTVKPPVWIEDVAVDNKPAHLTSGRPSPILKVAPGQQRVQFHFTALSFTAPERVRFKYRLQPLEKDWMEPTTQREATYSYLPPGDYVFHVIACNNDGLWNDTGAIMAIKVLPHVWQTIWFRVLAYSLAALVVGGAVLLVTRRRLHLKLERLDRQRALERERARIAKDIHDDVGATLTQITMLSQSARKELERPRQVAEHLDQIFAAARASTHALDEIVWAVNPKHDSLDSMATYLVKFAQDFLGPAGIRCRLEMPLQLPDQALTAEVRHNLFLAYKEALNNVVKHAAATEVRISLVLESGGFSLCVADNGRGFAVPNKLSETEAPADRVSGGNGLDNMKRRLDEIRGSCEIESAPGQGTKVRFGVTVR